MDWLYEKEVTEKIEYRPRLLPVFSHTLNIPERLYAYNPRLFLCFNRHEQRFEVHSLDQEDSYCCTVPFRELDARVLQWVWQNDIRMHGKEIFRRMEREEQKREKQKEREMQNWIRDVASETQSLFAKDAWTM